LLLILSIENYNVKNNQALQLFKFQYYCHQVQGSVMSLVGRLPICHALKTIIEFLF